MVAHFCKARLLLNGFYLSLDVVLEDFLLDWIQICVLILLMDNTKKPLEKLSEKSRLNANTCQSILSLLQY